MTVAVPRAEDFHAGPVVVDVPATSANLGPGFDCLGLALDLRDRLTAEVSQRPSSTTGDLAVEVDGEGADEVARDGSHLVVRAVRATFEALGVRVPYLSLRCENRIPHSRGLGSSSAAIVGGIVLARALVRGGADRLDDQAALALANRLEGHPDNVAPALLGGFCISGQSLTATGPDGDREVWAQRSAVHPDISAVVLVPPTGVRTEIARGLLPTVVPHAEAAANTGRAALLVAALAAAPERLHRATEDFLHQAHRRPAMPESLALVESLRDRGHAAVISGAGPTVLVLVHGGAAVEDLARATPAGWARHEFGVDHDGARVLPPS